MLNQKEGSLSIWRTLSHVLRCGPTGELVFQVILKNLCPVNFQGRFCQIEGHHQQADDPSTAFFSLVPSGFSRTEQKAADKAGGKRARQPFQRTGPERIPDPQRDIEFLSESMVRLADLKSRRISAADQFCEFGGFLIWFSHWRSFSNSWHVTGNAQGLLMARMIMNIIKARTK